MFLTPTVQVRNDEKAATEALTEDDIKAINALSKVIFISIVNYNKIAIAICNGKLVVGPSFVLNCSNRFLLKGCFSTRVFLGQIYNS